MTILTQLHVIRLLALGMLLILPATSGAQQRPPILEKLTKTYVQQLARKPQPRPFRAVL